MVQAVAGILEGVEEDLEVVATVVAAAAVDMAVGDSEVRGEPREEGVAFEVAVEVMHLTKGP